MEQIKDGQQVAFKDISGTILPDVFKWAGSLSGEFTTPVAFMGKAGNFFIGLDGFVRSSFSFSPSSSAYLNIDGLFNGRVGFRGDNGISVFL